MFRELSVVECTKPRTTVAAVSPVSRPDLCTSWRPSSVADVQCLAAFSGCRDISSCANIGGMLDRRLVGYWSDKDMYMAGMEAADIAFRTDGTGWTYWSSAAGGFEVLRFVWRQASRSALTLPCVPRNSGVLEVRAG
jgi:hypothetical protein